MKAEIDGGGLGGEGGGVTTYEMKQLEQQNDRLKEAVMKFRDLSQHEKQENVRLVKVWCSFWSMLGKYLLLNIKHKTCNIEHRNMKHKTSLLPLYLRIKIRPMSRLRN